MISQRKSNAPKYNIPADLLEHGSDVTICLLSMRSEVEPYVAQIREAADKEKDAFGFLPASAYTEFAYQGRMLIAVDVATRELAGYTVFGGALPQGRIFQTWASPKFRGQGVGRSLVAEVIRRLEDVSFLSIRADVASDLEIANQFYGELGFDVIRTRPGGKSRGRTINVRVRELATPSLLEIAADRSDSLGALSIGAPATARTPLYVLDLNVLFDVTKQRSRAQAASRVMAAAFENDVRLSISAELIKELERHTVPGKADPVLALATTLPRLPLPPRQRWDAYIRELAPILFPDRTRDGKLKVQDHSDLMHLITAIHECAVGFITSENAILKAAEYLRQQYGLDILSPEAFTPQQEADADNGIIATAGSSRIVAGIIGEADHDDAEALLRRAHATTSQIRAILSSGTATLPRRRFLIRVDGQIRAVGSWDAPNRSINARDLLIYVDEDHPSASICAEHLIGRAMADVGASMPAILRLATPMGQSTLRRVAISHGFFQAGGNSPRVPALKKVALGRVLTPDNWSACREKIRSRSGMRLPTTPPTFIGVTHPFEISDESGQCASPPLSEIERLLSPTLIILPQRPAVVLPITQIYAEELFRGSAQPTLLSDREAVLHAVRGYISKSGSYSVIKDGSIAVFYESGTGGGRSAAIAVARITRRYLMDKESASQYASQRAVLEARVIHDIGRSTQVAVSEFDNLMLFRKPVPLAKLRAIGCVDGANFVTARSLASEHLLAIVKAGEPNA